MDDNQKYGAELQPCTFPRVLSCGPQSSPYWHMAQALDWLLTI